MSGPAPTIPDGWSETSETVPGAVQTYVYHVGDGERVLVGLHPLPGDSDETELEVSSIEETATAKRHDFVVATYDSEAEGLEGLSSFTQFLSEALPADRSDDERLFETVQRCIEEFNATTDTWWSFFTS